MYPATTLGPGERVILWMQGCSKHCWGCANPEMWDANFASDLGIPQLAEYLNLLHDEVGAHRITFTGGDPLEQPEQLSELLDLIRPQYDDILVYTGYTLRQAEGRIESAVMDNIKANIDALIDGPYIHELNDDATALRGSTNQVIRFFTPGIEKVYERYMATGRSVMNVVREGRAISVGIHNRGTLTRRD